jgi:hypothetical protein
MENGLTIRLKAMASTLTLMDRSMKATGRLIYNTGKAKSSGPTNRLM